MNPINPLYISTFLDLGPDWSEQPEEFAIISGYATTGEKWSAERNQQADERLYQRLLEKGTWVRRVTGYAPDTGHNESCGQQPSLLAKPVILEKNSCKTPFTMLKGIIFISVIAIQDASRPQLVSSL